jgi:hypothetical protein
MIAYPYDFFFLISPPIIRPPHGSIDSSKRQPPVLTSDWNATTPEIIYKLPHSGFAAGGAHCISDSFYPGVVLVFCSDDITLA